MKHTWLQTYRQKWQQIGHSLDMKSAEKTIQINQTRREELRLDSCLCKWEVSTFDIGQVWKQSITHAQTYKAVLQEVTNLINIGKSRSKCVIAFHISFGPTIVASSFTEVVCLLFLGGGSCKKSEVITKRHDHVRPICPTK